MALFTDGPSSELVDLTAQDSQLLNVASVEGIDVTRKLELAQEELSLELMTMLEDRTADVWSSGTASVGNVVVTPALKLWHAYRTLELVYRDAYSNQLNDRYRAKRDQFKEQAAWAKEQLMHAGIGLCRNPVARAETPSVAGAPGSLADGTYYITMAWINEAQDEGACAPLCEFTVTGTTLLVQPGTAPASATGWNVYAGCSPEGMSRQNEVPIAPDLTWRQPDFVTATRQVPGRGQPATYYKPVLRTIQRG